jgi:uncharacterized protein YndB with AHSA1/START domain
MRSSFVVEAHSQALPDAVFAVLADARRWSTWAGPVVPTSSWERGSPAGGVGAVRRLGLGPLSSREEIVEFDPPRRLAYVLRSAERLHHYAATVELRPDPTGGTRVVWSGSTESAVPGVAAVVGAGFHRLVAGFARRLVRYAESVPPGQ